MTRIFLDTSAYAKRFIKEEGSGEIDEIISGADELGLSIICIPELFSAMNRRLKEKSISKIQYSEIKKRFAEEIFDIYIIPVKESAIEKSILILEKNSVRTLDAIHISCAMEWKADLFVTSDERQIKAAKSHFKNVRLI